MILQGDALTILRTLPAESVQCCITSPPYFGLRDYGMPGQLGLERAPEEYVGKLVEVFREVRRVLRKDGTLWLVLGDSYASSLRSGRDESPGVGAKQEIGRQRTKLKWHAGDGSTFRWTIPAFGTQIKPKDLVGIPWRVAFALQADGWYLRSDIIWSKPNPMPESVTDRPTKAHEYVFLLTRSASYYFDQEAVREQNTEGTISRLSSGPVQAKSVGPKNLLGRQDGGTEPYAVAAGRNIRSVWQIATAPYPESHFATFPPELAMRCIKAGTSEKGCCAECGTPWERVVETRPDVRPAVDGSFTKAALAGPTGADRRLGPNGWNLPSTTRATGAWRPGCDCAARCVCGHVDHDRYSDHDECHKCECDTYATSGDTIPPAPCTVIDPFFGAGTVGLVAESLGRKWVGVELNPAYVAMADRRIRGPLFAEG